MQPTHRGVRSIPTTEALLGLLADLDEGAPERRFEDDLAAAALPAELVSRLRALNQRLQRSRRREELLRVLHDTATDLTALRDVEAVLQAIVARTRQLVGSDMAYLSLNDYDREETFIRKSDGVVTPEYRSIRMPLGTGVLGKAATGLSPVAVVDYVPDPTIIHLAHIDAIVAAEGVRSILGVPLTVHGRVLGALLVAERQPRRFTAEEIDLVDSVGKHAAVALENAQRFAELKTALAEVGAEQRASRSELAEVQAVVELDESLIEVAVRGSGYPGLIAAASLALPYQMAIHHYDGRVLAASPEGWFESLNQATRSAIERTLEAARVNGRAQVVRSGNRTLGYTVAAAQVGDELLATVLVGAKLSARERVILDRLALFCAVMRLFGRATQAVEFAQQSAVVEDLVAGRMTDPEMIASQLRRFGIDPGSPVLVALVSTPEDKYVDEVRAGLGGQPGVVVQGKDHVCVLATPAALVRLQRAGEAGAAWRISHALAAVPQAIASAHRQAAIGLVSLSELGRFGIVDAATLGASAAVLAAGDDAVSTVLVPIRPLLDYDARHGTKLAATAWAYLEAESSIAEASRVLYVHRNTVTQRLARIAQLLGDDWARAPRRLDTHLALRIWAMTTHPAQH